MGVVLPGRDCDSIELRRLLDAFGVEDPGTAPANGWISTRPSLTARRP